MNKFICVLVLILFCLNSYGQNVNNIKMLVDKEEKKLCLIEVDRHFYLSRVSDIQLIDKQIIKSITIFLPDDEYFIEIIKKNKIKFDVKAVFLIEFELGKTPEKYRNDGCEY